MLLKGAIAGLAGEIHQGTAVRCEAEGGGDSADETHFKIHKNTRINYWERQLFAEPGIHKAETEWTRGSIERAEVHGVWLLEFAKEAPQFACGV